MIGWKSQRPNKQPVVKPKGFDDFELKLGDMLRGERATMGKSLLDVQRELRIKANYIAAIEDCNPDAFDTPGFIAGYVRSYARYLNLDPDHVYAEFCAESGFSLAQDMSGKAVQSPKAAQPRKDGEAAPVASRQRVVADPFGPSKMPFAPQPEGFLSRIEPGAVGSLMVLVALVGGIGYGGWSVLKEVQRVQITPVDQTPIVLSELDPLQGAAPVSPAPSSAEDERLAGTLPAPRSDALDRLYRPQALDVPVLVARDAPISTLDPASVGAFAEVARQDLPTVDPTSAQPSNALQNALAEAMGLADTVTLIAARPAWVMVRDTLGTPIFEQTLQPGDTWQVPADVDLATLTVGESGALYFSVGGTVYGPVGAAGAVTQDLPLVPDVLVADYAPAVLTDDPGLMRVVANLEFSPAGRAAQPRVLETATPGVTMVAVRPAWVRVRNAAGATIFEQIMDRGDTFEVPQTVEAANVRVGEPGAVYFLVNGRAYGPAGPSGQPRTLALNVDNLTTDFDVANIDRDQDLARVLAELSVAPLP